MSLATRVLLGFVLGVASGVFFGELIAPIGIVGDAFIRLLQMTVLPYVVVSLVLGLGQLSTREAGRLIRRSGALLLLLWAAALVFVVIMPWAYPNWEAASYFSPSLVEPDSEPDLINLFIPGNPFNSLATGIVPATVVFSLGIGAALIGIENKRSIIETLSLFSDALSRVAMFVIRFAPLGVFAISARAAGTLEFHELITLEVYIATYLVFWLVMGLWFLPMLVTSLTPLKYREVLGPSRDALLTAFATGSVFAVLPILAERSKELVRRCAPESKDALKAVNVLIPLSFTFPGPGTLLILGFIPFAAWAAGAAIAVSQWPAFLASGLLSLFGSTMVAVPFLLDQLRIPVDLFQLYIVSDVFTGRFGALISGIFILTFSALGACALAGTIRIDKAKLLRLFVGTIVLLVIGVMGVRLFFANVLSHEYISGEHFLDRKPLFSSTQAETLAPEEPSKLPVDPDATLKRILTRGVIRVGYRVDELPFAFENSSGQLVGHDIELAHLLAADLGVRLELLPVTRAQMAELLSSRAIDLVLSGVAVTSKRAIDMEFTLPYMDQTLAFVVPDYRRKEFSTRESLRRLKGLVVAVPDLPQLIERVEAYLDEPEIVVVQSPRQFFEEKKDTCDVLVYSAEAGSAWTLLHPEYSVVIPQPDIVRIPIALAVAQGNEPMRTFLNTWIDLKRRDSTLTRLYDHWILGKTDSEKRQRWSVIRDVLGWVE